MPEFQNYNIFDSYMKGQQAGQQKQEFNYLQEQRKKQAADLEKQAAQKVTDDAQKELGQMARYMEKVPAANRPFVYPQIKSRITQIMPGMQLPDAWDEASMAPVLEQVKMNTLKYFPDEAAPPGQETWMNGGNGTMISNRGNSKPIEGYVQRPVGGNRASGGGLSALPRKLSDDEIVTYANQMRDAGMPDENIQNFMVAQQSMPDVQLASPTPQKPAKSPKLSALQERVALAREMGASNEELKAIVMGGGKGSKAAGTGAAPASPKVTEDQSKAANWYASSQNALNNLNAALKEDPQALYPGITETYIPNNEAKQRSMSPARQKAAHAFNTMKMDFLHAATGAGFSIQEAQDEWTNLAPQRGDGDALAKQKLDQILVKIEAMGQRAGPALRAPNSPNANDANMTLPKMDSGPKPGTVEGGYRFNGGNPADPKSWVKI